MKNSIIAIGVFVAGILAGAAGAVPTGWDSGILPRIILYVLVVQVGLGLGSGGGLAALRSGLSLRSLLLPVCTIAGTVVFSALASLLFSLWSMTDCMAVGCGFGYYSLSSVIITGMKQAAAGAEGAAALGTLALMTNIVREMTAIAGAPLLVKISGKSAPVVAAGVTSMDSALPSISRYSGSDTVPAALVHGIVLEIATPILVTFFCSF